MEFSDLIALKITEIMKEKSVSIYRLESLTGVYSSTITLFLNRKTKTLRMENLLYICEGLNITLAEFFSDSRFEDAEAKGWIKMNHNRT